MSTPEGKVKLAIKDYLNQLKPDLWYWMPVNSGFGIKGIPDFVGCYRGRFFAIEAKRVCGRPKPWQDLVMNLIRAAGGIAVVIDNIEDLKALFGAL